MEASNPETINLNDGDDPADTSDPVVRRKLKNAVDLREFIQNGTVEFELDTDIQPGKVCDLGDFGLEHDKDDIWSESDEESDIPGEENKTEEHHVSSHEMEEDSDGSAEEEIESHPSPAVTKYSLPYFNNIAMLRAELKAKQERQAKEREKENVKRKPSYGLFPPGVAKGKVRITEDGELLKIILHHGNGTKPPIGSRVWIKYSIFKAYDRKRTNETAIDVRHQNVPFVFTLFNHDVIAALEYGVASMEVNEQAEFLASANYAYGPLGIPDVVKPNTSCIFLVELIKFVDASMVNLAYLNADEQEAFPFNRVKEEALRHKTSGNLRHKDRKWEPALQQYRKGVLVLERHLTVDKREDDERNELLFIFFNNMAQTYVEMGNGRQALACVAKAEELPTDTVGSRSKLMFRKCKAYMLLNKLDDALDACRKSKELEPANAASEKCFLQITQLIGAEKAASKDVFDKIGKAYFSTPSKA